MIQRFNGILQKEGWFASCIVSVDSDGAEYLSDDDIVPPAKDGEYDLEVSGVHKRALRVDGRWSSSDY